MNHFRYMRRGFQGCVHEVVLDEVKIDFAKDSIETANIVPCLEKAVFSSDYMYEYEVLLEETMEDFDEDQYLEGLNRISQNETP